MRSDLMSETHVSTVTIKTMKIMTGAMIAIGTPRRKPTLFRAGFMLCVSIEKNHQAGVAEEILPPMPENSATRSEPTVNTTTLIATAIPAAIRPYSIAVAPFSDRAKALILEIMLSSIFKGSIQIEPMTLYLQCKADSLKFQ